MDSRRLGSRRTGSRRPPLGVLALMALLSLALTGCETLTDTTSPPTTALPTTSLPPVATEPAITTTIVPVVVSYTDRAAFEAAAPRALQLVDFDTDYQGVPIVAESPGVHAGNYYKGYGIIFAAGVIFGEPNLPFNGVSAPNTISNSGDNTPTPALVDVLFDTPVYEVGITNTGAEAELRIFDEADTLIGSIRSDADEATNDFIGLSSNIPIRSMEFDFAGGMGFEGDDLLFTKIS